jgi:DNA adenine methylase
VAASTAGGPFLKWAGGKRQLLPQLRRFYPDRINRYFEPFLGSGAVFFDLARLGRLGGVPVVLGDDSPDLIGTYLRLTLSPDDLVTELRMLAASYTRLGARHYYAVRTQFNQRRAEWRAAGADVRDYTAALAAMLIFLNRTGYNGLFRLNQRGEFNVPGGRYHRPRILNDAQLASAAAALLDHAVCFKHADFETILSEASPGDFVYLDPPYAPLTATSSFRQYTARGFHGADQHRLRDLVTGLSEAGVHVVLSNSSAAEVVSLYDTPAAARAGLRCFNVPARRSINSRAASRGPIDELIVSNVAPRGPEPSAAGDYAPRSQTRSWQVGQA